MQRNIIATRQDYQKKLEELSFKFHSLNNIYWNESAYYSFTLREIDLIESATNELYRICLLAVQHVMDNNLYEKMHIDPLLIPLIERSWNEEEPSVYGRFDLAWNGDGEPKMLEYNADTPTAIYECSVVQYKWLEEVFVTMDQFNSIHERLIEYWKSCIEYFNGETVYFTCVRDSIEDYTTTEYMRDCCSQGGITTKFLYIDEIGWDEENQVFVDMDGMEIENIFKLYPYEHLISEDFGVHIMEDDNECRWIEPAWKAILSNKAILPILWELFPNHPNLLECYFEDPHQMVNYVKKPIYSREGANVSIVKNGIEVEISEDQGYGSEGFVMQQLVDLPNFDGNYAILGSWIISGESAGIGVRESDTLITDNLSRFVPHIIVV